MRDDLLLIFDMDGVLVDVSGSYREVVRQSVFQYLRAVLGAGRTNAAASPAGHNPSKDKPVKHKPLSQPAGFSGLNLEQIVSPSDVDYIKKLGGLNNDWDLTCAVLNTVLVHFIDPYNRNLQKAVSKIREKEHAADGILNAMRKLHKYFDTHALADADLRRPFSELYRSGQQEAQARSPFLFANGNIYDENLVKRIFQELYLGPVLFKEIYEADSLFYSGAGYVERESLIPSRSELEELGRYAALAIATGRPRAEADYALKRFGIEVLFEVVVTEDDIEEAEKKAHRSLRKPDPFTLKLCIQRCGFDGKGGGIFYVGDMPDDIKASQAAGVTPIGFVNGSSPAGEAEKSRHLELLMSSGASAVYKNYAELIFFIRQSPLL